MNSVADFVPLCRRTLHRKRGKEAIELIGVIPVYTGVLNHDCWASYFAYTLCKHQLCGSHLQPRGVLQEAQPLGDFLR